MIHTKLNLNSVIRFILSFFICTLLTPGSVFACTIVSGIAHNGHVWTANNEDGPFGVANFINVFPRSGADRHGYYTLSYVSPQYGQSAAIQGGMNEAGLSFDFNAIPFVEDFDAGSKKPYPEGNDAILIHILGNMRTVQEVIAFFETYWFVDGFRDAQMHVSDKNGRFAIISASGTELVEKGEFLVSTNFDICGKEDASSCWRYPIAVKKLSAEGASLETMEAICSETAQKNGATMYSNIQNLTTGEIWFFSKHDPGNILRTNLDEMLSKGQNSYTFNDLNSIKEQRLKREWKAAEQLEISQDALADYTGTYEHRYIGPVNVRISGNGLEVSFVDGTKDVFYSTGENVFSLPDYDIYLTFEQHRDTDRMKLNLYESGIWSFSVEKPVTIEHNTDSKK